VNAALLLLVWSWPLVLAALAGQRHARWMTVMAPLPALLTAAFVPVGTSVSVPWLLLGVELGVDDIGRVFLLFSALLWLIASVYEAGYKTADGHGARYRVFFLLAMAGNLGLIVAQDTVSFYLGFTLMGLAAYGLIVHPARRRARQAARRYLAWTIAGELILFIAIVSLALQHGGALAFFNLQSNPPAGFVVLLLIIGFGIKLALPGLHLWLPQAYAVAPSSAVAVLSGAMIKAGLLGWLRFLPPGDAALAGWGQALMVTGVIGIFFGAVLGLLQRRPRLLLGYSSISKMGVLTTGMGASLAWPAAAPALVSAMVLYAAHHALAKGALFLGLGLVERGGLRPWLLAGLGFLALVLAGAPLTSGALAKSILTAGLPVEAHYLVSLLAAGAFATTLLMARFLFLIWEQRNSATMPQPSAATSAWFALLAVILAFPFVLAGSHLLSVDVAPVLLGALLSAVVLLAAGRLPRYPVMRQRHTVARRLAVRSAVAIRRLWHAWQQWSGTLLPAWHKSYSMFQQILGVRVKILRQMAAHREHWPLAGSLWLGIGGLLLAAFITSG
jgi:formate hydrogenlyase subunit 3/multisubunit Na+/H+ antiporter MnhD subunit